MDSLETNSTVRRKLLWRDPLWIGITYKQLSTYNGVAGRVSEELDSSWIVSISDP